MTDICLPSTLFNSTHLSWAHTHTHTWCDLFSTEDWLGGQKKAELLIASEVLENTVKIGVMNKEERKEIFYLTMCSTHFIYCYMVKDHSDSERKSATTTVATLSD